MFIVVKAVATDNPEVSVGYFEIEVADDIAETVASTVGGVVPEGYEWTVTTSETSRMEDPLADAGGEGEPDPVAEW